MSLQRINHNPFEKNFNPKELYTILAFLSANRFQEGGKSPTPTFAVSFILTIEVINGMYKICMILFATPWLHKVHALAFHL